MKKFNLLFVCVLLSTGVFANDTVEPNESVTTAAVTNAEGSSVFKLYYKGEQAGLVSITILDKNNTPVYSEWIRNKNGFVRPYNFSDLGAGTYTMVIEDKQGKQSKTVTYSGGKIEKIVNLVKMNEEGKYLLSVKSTASDRITVSVYDKFNKLIHSEAKNVKNDFAEVLNLKNINQFTIEISDGNGVLKTLKN